MITNNLGHYGVAGVYRITNTITGDFYIGSSVNIGKRWSAHFRDLERGTHTNRFILRSFQKHGKESFLFEVLERTNDLIHREQYFIDTLKPSFNLFLFAYGGMRGRTISSEHRKALSKANKNRKLTKEHIEKIKTHKNWTKVGKEFWKNSVKTREKPVIVWLNEITPVLFDRMKDVISFFKLEGRYKTMKHIYTVCRRKGSVDGLKLEYA